MPSVINTMVMKIVKKSLIIIIAVILAVFGYCQYHRAENYKEQLQNKEVIYESGEGR
jgi:uncharacterized membrane protein YidH (DUF202 family)